MPLVSMFLAIAQAVELPIQGVLLDPAGGPIDGTREVTLRLYADDTDTDPVVDTQNVTLTGGAFATTIGRSQPIDPAALGAAAAPSITIAVGTGPESARVYLAHAPLAAWAARSGEADHATNATQAETATWAATAAQADNASWADEAGWADNAGLADNATWADDATHAETADEASAASFALTAANATNLGGVAAANYLLATGNPSIAGALQIGGASATCSGAGDYGRLRFNGTTFQGCTSGGWAPLAGSATGFPSLSFSPSSLDFGTVTGAQSSTQAVTLSNSGTVAATALSLLPTTGAQVASTTCGTSVAASGSCTINVRMAFDGASGPRTAALIATSAAGSPSLVMTATWSTPNGSAQASAGRTCKTIRDDYPSLTSGTFWIDPNGGDTADAFQAYCDMSTNGGGWTLCLSNVERGKGTQIDDTNGWWTTTWDKGSRVLTRGAKTQGSSWGNFCRLLTSQSTQVFATVYSEANAVAVGDVCTLSANWFTPDTGHQQLSCGGSTKMSAIPKSGFQNFGCTGCIYWDNEITPNTSPTGWGHNLYGTHVMVKVGGSSAYGAAGIHWGNVNPGMAVGAAGDVNCGSQGGWCYEAYTSGHAAWQKSMQLWLR